MKKKFLIIRRQFEGFFYRNFVVKYIEKITGNIVASGPFLGMKYADDSIGSRLIPKILGTYELELHSIIEKACQKSFDTIIDVGAAEGYYAVGMALRNPSATVIAFETENSGRMLIKKMADINAVADRVFIRGFCDFELLSGSIPDNNKKCLIIMDIEGAESVLLDNSIIPKLNNCYILVEIHECVDPGVGDIILGRFKNTHTITEIKERIRVLEDFPLPIPILYKTLFKKYFVFNSMDEGRFDSLIGRPEKNTNWFYLEPK